MNKAIVTAFGFFLFHLFLAYYFELIDDEVYYNLWSSSISFGYYDHLPMRAWWICAGKFVFGETVIVVRILTCVAFFLVSILIARIVFDWWKRSNFDVSILIQYNGACYGFRFYLDAGHPLKFILDQCLLGNIGRSI